MISVHPPGMQYSSGLLSYLKSVEVGKGIVLRTPMFKSENVDNVLDRWLHQLEGHADMFPPALMDLELSQLDKVGPKSVRFPLVDRMPDIKAYFTSFRKPEVDLYMRETMDYFSGQRRNYLNPLDLARAMSQLPQNTNSGFPFFTKRGKVKNETYRMAVRKKNWFQPAILGWRGQSGGRDEEDVKQRVVFIFSYITNAIEATFSIPAYEYLKWFPEYAAWVSQDATDERITSIFEALKDNEVILSSDYSGYDQHVGPEQMSIYADFMTASFPSKFASIIEEVISNVNTVPLIVAQDRMLVGKHGLGSGSNLTNQAGSYINANIQYASPHSVTGTGTFLGDDGVIIVRSVDQHLDFLGRVGFDANVEKQMISKDNIHYLQRLYYRHYRPGGACRGIFPTMRALGALLWNERHHDPKQWSHVMETIRMIMIVQNTEWHPLYKEFVHFTGEGDKYLKSSLKKIKGDPSHVRVAKSIPGFLPTYTQERNIDGLTGFKTFKILCEKVGIA